MRGCPARPAFLLLTALFSFFLLATLGSAGTACAETPVTGTTDTVHVERHKLTLEEILARCMQGEKTKLAGHHDMTYTLTLRSLVYWEKKKEVNDEIFRVFADDTGFGRSVKVGEEHRRFKLQDGAWVPDKQEEGKLKFEVSDGFSDFVEMPFFLELQNEFDFELLDRTIEDNHVIFKVGFKPKSDFKTLPAGTVYVDTDAYRIVHEEFTMVQNPLPLVLKDVKNITRHWEELPGGEWVFTRILMEVELRDVFFGQAPQRVSLALLRDGFHFDKGYDERIFGGR